MDELLRTIESSGIGIEARYETSDGSKETSLGDVEL